MIGSNKILLFDLDGTILDSTKSVIESLRYAISKNCSDYMKNISNVIIGPKVPKLLKNIVPDKYITKVTQDFRIYFDSEGYKATVLFPEVKETLENLSKKYVLNVATNKPKDISIKILKRLNIYPLFDNIFSTYELNYLSKTDLLLDIEHHADIAFVIGDSEEDFLAAIQNKLKFIYCSYGYGHVADHLINKISNFKELNNLLLSEK